MSYFDARLTKMDAALAAARQEADEINKRIRQLADDRCDLIRDEAAGMTDEQILADENMLQRLMYFYATRSDGEPRIADMLPGNYDRPIGVSGYQNLDRETRCETESYDDVFFVPAFQLIIERDADLDAAHDRIIEIAERWRFGRTEITFRVFTNQGPEYAQVVLHYRTADDCQLSSNNRKALHAGTLAEALAAVQRNWWYD